MGAVDYRVNERRRRMLVSAFLHLVSHGIAATYCVITLGEPNRPLMLAAYASGMAVGAVGVWAAKTVTTKASVYRISFVILLISLTAIALGAHWDGGAGSPAALGFVSTAVFLAIYTPQLRLMVGLEALNIGAYLLVGAVGQPPRPGHVFIHVAGMVCLISACGTQARIMARQRAQLRSLAELDPLTGALNRRGLAKLAERLSASPHDLGPSVICLDLDDFKLVNDRFGHSAGDELLQWTVAVTRDVLRAGDAITRTGGDEFVIVLVDADEAAARAMAGRIGGVVGQRTGVSVGSASAPSDGDTLDALIKAADLRLYRVKRDRHGGPRPAEKLKTSIHRPIGHGDVNPYAGVEQPVSRPVRWDRARSEHPMNTSLPASLHDRALEAVEQAVIVTDLDGRVLYWNATAEELYGYEASQALGCLLGDLIAPARQSDAHIRHLAAVVENSDNAIIETDLDGLICAVNPAVKGVIGYEPAELIGRHVDILIPPAESALVGAVRDAVLNGESPEVFATKSVRKDGSLIDVAVRLSPVRDEAGAIVRVSRLSRDLTAEMRAREELAASERLFRARFEQVRVPQAEVSLSGHLIRVNDAACGLLGRQRHEIEGASLRSLYHPSDTGAADERLAALLRGDVDAGSWERVLATGDGSAVPVLIQAAALKDADGAPYGIAGFLHDLRELREAERALRASEARYRAIAETAQEGIWAIDRSGHTLYANDKLAAILGIPIEEIYRRPPADLLGSGNSAWVASRLSSRAERGVEEYELSYQHPDGGTRVLRVSASPLHDDTGQTGSLAMISDVTCARRAERELQRRVLRDELTGLANRALLTDRLERALARSARANNPVTVIMADLDQFKLINDTWGHDAGDQLLVRVGQRLVAAVRADDTVARFGGDGFVLVCEDTDEARAREVADRIMAAFSEPFDLEGQRLHVRASLGIAVCPPHSAPDLVRFAEAAMYDAKARGRNRVQLFDGSLAEDSADRLALSNDLRDALARDELVLHYQPLIDLATGQPVGVEALARWQHPSRGPVSPAKFVAVAEATGLASTLDRWALDRVRRDAGQLRKAIPRLHVAVNISATHLSDPDLEEAVLSALRGGQMSTDELLIEVTESAMIDNLDQARAALERLRAHGVHAAIDDFGTGYSSLGYLSRLPISTVKIDRSFIEHIGEDRDALTIASSVIRMARRLRLTTIAEGVETPKQLAILRQLGCTTAQGFLFSPAVAPASLAEVVEGLANQHVGTELAG